MRLTNISKNKLNSKISWLFNLESDAHYVLVWIPLKVTSAFCVLLFFFFFFSCTVSALGGQEYYSHIVEHCSHTIEHYLYTVWHCLQVKKNIKNRSHDTIYIFKNNFATVFSIFSFSNNKFNPNGP